MVVRFLLMIFGILFQMIILVFLVEKIVERIDFSEWEELHWDTPGNPAYHPRVSLRAVVQGYIDGVRSGRELGRRVKTDFALYLFMWC